MEFYNLQIEIQESYDRLKVWREVARAFGVSPAMAWKIAHGVEPVDADIRKTLGLPVLKPAPVCKVCGEIHTTKKCMKRVKLHRHKDLLSYPKARLRDMLLNRKEM
jgi:hypothetical protein